jgi:hypothetical protein
VVEAKRLELRVALALCLGTATQKVVDQVLQPGGTGVELFAAVPDQAAAVRTGDPLAPVARLSDSNPTAIMGDSGLCPVEPCGD